LTAWSSHIGALNAALKGFLPGGLRLAPLKRKSYLLTIVTILLMLATKRIPVTENVWVELSALKKAGQTYSQLLEEMIEDRKKARLFRDMEKIEEEGEFVEFPW